MTYANNSPILNTERRRAASRRGRRPRERRSYAENQQPRRVGAMPRCCRFGAEAARRDNFHIAMTVEEYETIRLIDYLGKTQEECASLMNVGRGTVQMLYAEARKKLARFLVEGCRLEIGGGDFVLDGAGRADVGQSRRLSGGGRGRACPTV